MEVQLIEDLAIKNALYPFAEIRAVADIRLGILTLREKWSLYKDRIPASLSLPANTIPSVKLLDQLEIAGDKGGKLSLDSLTRPWEIFEKNDAAIRDDFELIRAGRKSAPIPETVQTISSDNIFIEEGAVISHCILNAATGPIYIGRNAQIMEGATIRGPFALCEGAVVKMGARIYGATTVGPYSVVGGEIKNVVIFGYSNKAHDGYLGDSVIGEWCNLGAGTSNSNIRNTASDVKLWHQPELKFLEVGLKCGLMMGDYSRSAINTSFNTATVVGVGAHVFGNGLTPKYIPDFSWGIEGNLSYDFEKAIIDITNWKKLKNKNLSEHEMQTLKTIFDRKKK
ncbi:MAG: glucose-1-phosphate thymidylyltransferase [Chitinophagaceae bacterium]|nr:glucose-1-phosphate thymidylyltransferase [Chitinophagaceae bacterium]